MKFRELSERLAIAAEQNKKEKEFWYNQLAGELSKTHFPFDFKLDGKFSSSETIEFHLTRGINDSLYSRLSTITKGSDYTLNLVLITGVILLLNKYTGNNDILVGMPIYKQEIEGDYINTVVILRSYIENDMTFKSLLMQVKKTITDSIENQNYPVEILANKLTIDKKNIGFPLFDIAILLENIQKKEYLNHIDCNISIIFKRHEENISIAIKYKKSLYKKTTIENIIIHYSKLLQKVLYEVNILLSNVEIITEKEKKELLITFNNTSTNEYKIENIYTLFRMQMEKTPEKTAVTSVQTSNDSQTLSYRELNKKILSVGEYLKTQGLIPGKIIGLLLDRSVEIPIGIFGILSAGCTYMPIDPEFPKGRIGYMLKDSNAAALITTHNLSQKVGKIKNWKNKTIFFDNADKPDNPSDIHTYTNNSFEATNFAYTIYTSGTTGKPKGVLLTHNNLINYSNWFAQTNNLTENDKTILTSSFAFDLGYTSLYPSLLNGCELHILPREIYLLGEQLLSYIKEKEITYLKVTPSLFSMIIKSPNFNEETCTTLRLIVIGGEAINLIDIEKAHHTIPHIQIMNHYGPTEATIGCVATFINFKEFEEYKSHPIIGKPIYNTKIFILNRNLNMLPIGVSGELCISGLCLAKGYLNLPELTRVKFINFHVFDRYLLSYLSKNNLYRTGDLARWHNNGTIEFLGRIDNQVKVMGYRIELGEIQNRLQKHIDIKNAYLMVRESSHTSAGNGAGEKYLCAYIVPKGGACPTLEKETSLTKLKTLRLKDIMKEKNIFTPFRNQKPDSIDIKYSLFDHIQKKIENYRDKIAVIADDKYLTYDSLEKYASALLESSPCSRIIRAPSSTHSVRSI